MMMLTISTQTYEDISRRGENHAECRFFDNGQPRQPSECYACRVLELNHSLWTPPLMPCTWQSCYCIIWTPLSGVGCGIVLIPRICHLQKTYQIQTSPISCPACIYYDLQQISRSICCKCWFRSA